MQMRRWNWFVWLNLVFLMGCGATSSVSGLMGGKESHEKTRCPGSHQGFYVCLGSASRFSDQSVRKAVVEGLAKLPPLVNSGTFQGQVTTAFSSGKSIVQSLLSTNYIVTISGYCEPRGDALAKASVEGDTISYNECRVTRDALGNPSVPEVAGVLLHEISHNIGYTHPEEDSTRLTVPYYLGDTAEKDLGGTVKPVDQRRPADRIGHAKGNLPSTNGDAYPPYPSTASSYPAGGRNR